MEILCHKISPKENETPAVLIFVSFLAGPVGKKNGAIVTYSFII